jgi:hypothetical protein
MPPNGFLRGGRDRFEPLIGERNKEMAFAGKGDYNEIRRRIKLRGERHGGDESSRAVL